jgi:hypothetical protein
MTESLFSGPGVLIGFFLGVLVGWVTLWSFLNPQVGRIVARIGAIFAIGFGVMWIVTPIADLIDGKRDPRYESLVGHGGSGDALGWGAGAFVVGIMALVFSFLRKGGKVTPKQEDKASASAES